MNVWTPHLVDTHGQHPVGVLDLDLPESEHLHQVLHDLEGEHV